MNAGALLALICAAFCLFAVNDSRSWAGSRSYTRRRHRIWTRGSVQSAESLPRMVRQLASLLAAGRSGPALWGAMAHVLGAEQYRFDDGAKVLRRVSAANPVRLPQQIPGSGPSPRPAVEANATLLLVLAVQRASTMGLPTATAIRNACAADFEHGRRITHGLDARRTQQRRTWLDIAACFEVCETSGAPVAAVLERLACSIDADHDAAALRETALAGPRATARLLSWLPFIGLGLGMVMGVDPLAALLGSPLGWMVLTVGVGFTVVGKLWSAKMIGDAARPVHSKPSGRR